MSGSWRGNYYYESVPRACGFEAVFLEINGHVEGNILDDGKLGEARVIGTFANSHLTFTKTYFNSSLQVVSYEGVLSDEGKQLSGTWQIQRITRGRWVAWRQEDEIPDEQIEDDIDKILQQGEARIGVCGPQKL